MSLQQYAKRSLLRVVDAYQSVQPTTDGVLSKTIYGATWFIDQLRANAKTTKPNEPASGPSFGLQKYDEIIEWFETHWPIGAKWPDGVPHDGKLVRVPLNTRKKAKDADGKEASKGKAKTSKKGKG